jgi:predicted dehydrogenase
MNRRDFIYSSILSSSALAVHARDFSMSRQVENGKRIGIIGLDTSHSEVFTRMIHGGSSDMMGYRVVAAYGQGSKDIPSALQLKQGVTAKVREMGVEIVDSIGALLEKVDVVLLESNDGRVHLEQAMPVFKAGKRFFIDKPVAANLEGARAIFRAAEQHHTPIFSSSALRYDPNVRKVAEGAIGNVTGADVYTPAEIEPHHSDLAWYAIHGVEMLFSVMGPGCKSVSRTYRDGADVTVGVWDDGRIGTVRGIRNGASNIAGTAFGTKGISPLGPFAGYEPLVKQIIAFFETGKVPVSPAETIEIFSFIEAADLSRRKDGKTVHLDVMKSR